MRFHLICQEEILWRKTMNGNDVFVIERVLFHNFAAKYFFLADQVETHFEIQMTISVVLM